MVVTIEHFDIRFYIDLTLDQLDSLLYIMFAWYFAEVYELAFIDIEARIIRLALFLVFAIYIFLFFLFLFVKSLYVRIFISLIKSLILVRNLISSHSFNKSTL